MYSGLGSYNIWKDLIISTTELRSTCIRGGIHAEKELKNEQIWRIIFRRIRSFRLQIVPFYAHFFRFQKVFFIFAVIPCLLQREFFSASKKFHNTRTSSPLSCSICHQIGDKTRGNRNSNKHTVDIQRMVQSQMSREAKYVANCKLQKTCKSQNIANLQLILIYSLKYDKNFDDHS